VGANRSFDVVVRFTFSLQDQLSLTLLPLNLSLFFFCAEVRFSALNPLTNSSSLANELVSIRFVSSSSSSSCAIRSTSAYKSSFSAFQRNPHLSLKSLPTGKRLHFTSNISTCTKTSFASRTPRVSTTPVTKPAENLSNITSNATITTTSTVLRPKGLFFKRNMSIAVGLGGVSGAATACAGLGASLGTTLFYDCSIVFKIQQLISYL